MEFRFTNEIPASQTDRVVNHLLQPRLWIATADYPDYEAWAQRVHTQLRQETKRAMAASYGNQIVGVTIYQRHQTKPEVIEGRNISINPTMHGRHIASFLVRQTEIEGARDFPGTETIVWDAKANNLDIRNFLLKQHYVITGEQDLYGLSAGTDVIYEKLLGR